MRWVARVANVAVIVGVVAAGASTNVTANASGLGCHGAFTFPGGTNGPSATSPDDDVYDAVMVLNRKHITCAAALQIAAKAYALNDLKVERGPQFGAGGWGGPFRTGAYHCFVLNRGSDFINARCSLGSRYIRFLDHRQYWSIPAPGWQGPTQIA